QPAVDDSVGTVVLVAPSHPPPRRPSHETNATSDRRRRHGSTTGTEIEQTAVHRCSGVRCIGTEICGGTAISADGAAVTPALNYSSAKGGEVVARGAHRGGVSVHDRPRSAMVFKFGQRVQRMLYGEIVVEVDGVDLDLNIDR